MKKFWFFIPIIFLIVATTFTKNSTKQLDKEIFQIKENIRFSDNHNIKEIIELIQKDIENLNWIEIINNKIKISNLYNDNERKK